MVPYATTTSIHIKILALFDLFIESISTNKRAAAQTSFPKRNISITKLLACIIVWLLLEYEIKSDIPFLLAYK
jgi:hypothetical protein